MHFEIIGFAAAACTTASFVPQVYQTWKTKSTTSLSVSMLMVSVLGTLVWFVYGMSLQIPSIILSSSVSCLLQIFLLHCKLHYERGWKLDLKIIRARHKKRKSAN